MTSWNSREILDLGPLTDIFGGIDENARNALTLFLTSTQPLLVSIQMKLRAGDLKGADAAAHSAKGAANVTGAFRLGQLCAEICTALQQGDGARADVLAAKLPDAFAEVQNAIQRL